MQKKTPIGLLMFSLFVLTSITAEAHPPKEVNLSYSVQSKELSVTIDHVSRDHMRHYIRKMIVSVNGEETTEKFLRQQINPAIVTQVFTIEAEKDDTLGVKVYCSEGGVLSAQTEVSE